MLILNVAEKSKKYKHNDHNSMVNEDNGAMRFYASQEEQDLARLQESMNLTATQKFRVLMGLMKAQKVMHKAVIHHKD